MNKRTANPQAIAEALITSESYHHVYGTTTTVCTMRVGTFVVVGKSACVNPAKFDADLGVKWAREDALNKLTECVAFWLACSELLEAQVPL